ncbi:MAG: hypothetical protein IKI84_12880 [Clostridia bacterium]|nr:hypothetical protein [Clostridia bacterium]
MAQKSMGPSRIIPFLLMLFLAVLIVCTTACADDIEQLKYLPGQWTFSDAVLKEGGLAEEIKLTLTLGETGEMSLFSYSSSGRYDYRYAGTWSSEYVPDGMDRLTLRFTSTDNPLYAGRPYSMACVYRFYTESWVENDTWNIFLALEEIPSNESVSPFTDLYGDPNPALDRQRMPNMRVVRCSEYVSLRETRSTSSRRLAKVPLGALVLAFPEYGTANGFIECVYHGLDGYILSEYLEPAGTPGPVPPGGAVYGLAIDKLATRTGPGTQYDGGGTYSVKGQYIRILSRAYDKSNGIWWVKCEIPYKGDIRVLWTGWKRFDHTLTRLEDIPVDPNY